jgi:hypothetical protein
MFYSNGEFMKIIRIFLILVLVLSIIVFALPVSATGSSWVYPTSYADAFGGWSNEANVYDGNDTTYATSTGSDFAFNGLELIPASTVTCSSVKILAVQTGQSYAYLNIYVYYSGAWHNIRSSSLAITGNVWFEIFVGSTQSVEKALIINDTGNSQRVYGFQFYSINAPTINANLASNVATTTARLNSLITDDGGDTANCTIKFGYGKTSQTAVNFNNYTTKTSVTVPTSTYSVGSYPYLDVTGLDATTVYYYRVQITNSKSVVTSTNEITFTTLGVPTLPLNVQASPLSTSVHLTWALGSGSGRTLIMYRTDTYPTSTSDGTQIFLDVGTSYAHTGLVLGTTYYYSLWGESGGSYSASYASIAITTQSTGATQTGFGTVTTPDNFDLSSKSATSSNITLLQNLGPFYGLINGFVASWGMSLSDGWAGIYAFFIVLITLIIYIRSQSITGALLGTIVLMIVGYFIGIVSGWWILFGVAGFAGSLALPKREV